MCIELNFKYIVDNNVPEIPDKPIDLSAIANNTKVYPDEIDYDNNCENIIVKDGKTTNFLPVS